MTSRKTRVSFCDEDRGKGGRARERYRGSQIERKKEIERKGDRKEE